MKRHLSSLLAMAAAVIGGGKSIGVIDHLRVAENGYAPGRQPSWRRGKPNPAGTKLARKAAKGRISRSTIR